jgi:hypothetical protein
MATRSVRGSVKLNVSLSQAQAKLAKEMSPDPANTHQGQQPVHPVLHQQAGYKTATVPAKPTL